MALTCSEYSKQLNDSRIMILQAREDALQGIVKDVQSRLSQYSSNKKKYTSLLTDLILQVNSPFKAQVHAYAQAGPKFQSLKYEVEVEVEQNCEFLSF